MISVEMHGGGGGGGIGGGRFDPSDLHLKKELTQIRKAARVLRDPGTSSTWRSPLNSARSLTKHHYVHHHKNGKIDGIAKNPSSEKFSQTPLQIQSNGTNNYSNDNAASITRNDNLKDKKVFLYNWRSQKSESERSRQIGEDSVENKKVDGSSFSQNESVDMDSLSDARNGGGNDSQTDPYFSDRNASLIFNSKDFTPSIRRAIKKSKRGNYSTTSLKKYHHNHKVQEEMLLSRCAKNGLIDHSDDTEDYCNSEDLRGASAISPFLVTIKNKGWARSNKKEDDSISYSTPALSTSSFNKYGIRRNPSIVESWDATTGSFNDADDEVDDDQLDLPGRQGCGIPCYWSKRSTPKSRIGYGSCSPSLSDTLRRKGSSILCGNGNRTMYRKKNHRSSLNSKNRRLNSRKVAQSLVPLLTNNGSGNSEEDEISDNFGELDLEALSRLDGRRWSTSCKSQEGLELVAVNRELESSPENVRSLSHKYRPMFFDELIGQNIVVQSLASALSRKRIAPVYLFQGPRGTGKTSTARIFAAALNCLAAEDSKPCGVCRECANFISGKSKYIKEVDGSNKIGIDKIKYHLKNLSVVDSEYKVFIVEECHLLPSKTWLTFLRLLEKPLPRVVFILVTTDIDNVPRAILSRCQRHLFNKISSADIVIRLRKIVSDENLDVESVAFELIASNADGSLRDAETMLDQLSLFGKRINVSLVNELIGVVSDDKLLDLLEIAMSSNATETVIRARELMDSGVDPIVLMSQMATLIVDIIAGTYPNIHAKHNDSSFFGARSLPEREIERLKHALTVLSEAEKHLRVSSERSTWFTATILQLGSVPSPDRTHSGLSSRRQSSKATEEDYIDMLTAQNQQQRTDDIHFEKLASPTVAAAHHNSISKENPMSLTSFDSNPNQSHSKMLLNIWDQCIEKCHSKTLRQLLQSYGKLVSIFEMKGGFVAHIAFVDCNVKTRAEGFLSSITNSFEIVLRRNVEVKIILLPDSFFPKPMDKNNIAINPENRSTRSNISEGNQTEPLQSKEKKTGIPVQRIESIIREQRLETAWLQAMEKGGTPAGSMSRFKPERNQVLPNELESISSLDVPLQQQWDDELNHEIKALKINEAVVAIQKDQIAKRIDHYPVSPSALQNSRFASNFSKDNIGYESGSGAVGCNGLFCWNSTRAHRRTKAKRGTPIRGRKSGRFSWFGECAKARSTIRYNNR